MTQAASRPSSKLPLLLVDTNVLFDYFLGRDPDVDLLAALSRQRLEIRVPELVLLEFRGSILRELGRLEDGLNKVAQLATDLQRADHTSSAVDAMREASGIVREDLIRRRNNVDKFVAVIRKSFEIEPHTPELHYRGDLRYLQGLPPDDPRRGIQDCRIMEAVLAIANADSGNRRGRFLLSKDADFLKKPAVAEELRGAGVELVGKAAPLYRRVVAGGS